MSDVIENQSLFPDDEPGSRPLANVKWESYASERALCSSRMVAYRNAGFDVAADHNARGNAAKLERKRAVADRIAWLCRQDEDVLRAKRDKIEAIKWEMINVDIGDYFVMVERPVIDKEGKQTFDAEGKPCMRMVQDVKPFAEMTLEQRSVIQSLKYTDSGRPILEFYSKQWAVVELKKMLGIGANAQTIGDEFSDMTMAELAMFIMREQAAIGLKELARFAGTGDSPPTH